MVRVSVEMEELVFTEVKAVDAMVPVLRKPPWIVVLLMGDEPSMIMPVVLMSRFSGVDMDRAAVDEAITHIGGGGAVHGIDRRGNRVQRQSVR